MSPADGLPFAGWLAHAIDAVRLNVTLPISEDGKPFWLKRRRRGSGWVIACGNIFLKMSRSKIVMFPDVEEWRTWESSSYDLLYGAKCQLIGTSGLQIPSLPGQSLKTLLNDGRLTSEIMEAAAREFRRAHSLVSPLIGATWSHGDPHLMNVLYDQTTGEAYLIDFETRHEADLDVHTRHADDLLVFLLDLLGRDTTGNWQHWSEAFLLEYGDPAVLAALGNRLLVPSGWEAVLWKTRTAYLPRPILAERLAILRTIIEHRLLIEI